MAATHPFFGVGPGKWSGQYLAFAPPGDPTVRAGLSPTNRLPSSDVVGFLAERGAPATAVVIAIGATLARGRDRDRWLRRATLLAMLIVGSLDAVLQLGPHLLLVAWLLGTAKPVAASITMPIVMLTPAPTPTPTRRAPFFALAAAASVAAVLASSRAMSFVLFAYAHGIEDRARAAELDRGDVALRLAVAETWIESGRCDRALRHLRDAARFSAPTPAANALAARCR